MRVIIPKEDETVVSKSASNTATGAGSAFRSSHSQTQHPWLSLSLDPKLPGKREFCIGLNNKANV